MAGNTKDGSIAKIGKIEKANAVPVSAQVAAPFSKGVNFSQWFEKPCAADIQFTFYAEQDFIDAKSIGADHVRLPVKMHSMTQGAPDFALDPLMLKYLDTAIDWAEKHGLYIIIDNHSYDPILPTRNDIDGILLKIWAQLAQRYKDRSNYVVYEILNEPHGISDRLWGKIQGAAIEAIRKVDTKHTVVVGGTDYNSLGKMTALPKYDDPNFIYTFHFYDPHVFTHQGASWGSPSMVSLAGVPFPFDRKRMPKTPKDLKGTWLEDGLNQYESNSSFPALCATLDRAAAFSLKRNVPVYCGEFGVYMIQSPAADRVKWYEFICTELDKRNIARTNWDYFGGFGLFNTPNGRNFKSDLNADIVRALGFKPPTI